MTHRSFNFTKDGNDYGLRNIGPVIQKSNPAFTLNASPTGGVSSANTCIGCHQARPPARRRSIRRQFPGRALPGGTGGFVGRSQPASRRRMRARWRRR